MKRFLGFVKKEFYHIFRDPRTMLILFGIPVAQVLIFGFVVNTEIKDVKIAVLDQSKDEVTKKITSKLLSSGYFLLNKNLKNHKDIQESFQKGEIKEVIIFEPNFSKKLERENNASVQLLSDASDPNMASLIVNYTSAIIKEYTSNNININKNLISITPETRMFYNPELKSVYMFVPGTIAMILMLVSAMMTSISIVREKELGTMETLLVSPLRPSQIVIGKVTPYIAISFINAITIILLGYFVFGLPVQGSIVLLLLESILFILLALSLGILISTISTNQQVAMFISMFALMLPTILLSGFIFPIDNMPVPLQLLSHIMPPKYFIVILKDIMLKGNGISYIWEETLILTGMIILFLIISIKKFKIRLE